MDDDTRDQSQYQGKGKKGARPESLHTERPKTIPPPPDWEAEQAVIREALKRGHIHGPGGGARSCRLRRHAGFVDHRATAARVL